MVLGKSSISAFATTNLDDRLREAGVGQGNHRRRGDLRDSAVHDPLGGRHRVQGDRLRRRMRLAA